MAAIVIVIISNYAIKPIIPRIKKAAKKFGMTPIDKVVFLKIMKNIANIPSITTQS